LNYFLPKTSHGYFFEHGKQQKSAGVSVLSAYYGVRNSYADIKTLTHPFWVLDYSVDNCGLCRVGKKTAPWHKRVKGCAHLYAPETSYWEDYTSAPLPISSSFITFYGGENLDLIKHVNNGSGFGCFIDKTGRLGDLLSAAALEAAAGGEKSYWLVMAKFYEIINMLHSAQSSRNGLEKIVTGYGQDDNRSRDLIFIETVRKYLQERIGINISISDLAGHLNASSSTISHKYKELTGESPMKTLTTFRINAVKNLLAKGESIKFIADQTGFCDEFHLSKVFKQVTGSSPSVYLHTLHS
jgi:AraC-like DNA-binding protein